MTADPPPPNLVLIIRARLDDIPAMLRRCADSIESGERGQPFAMAAVLIDTDGRATVWGWGDVPTELTAVGILTLGAHYLCENKVQRG